MWPNTPRHPQHGVTLVEMLVVVAILSIVLAGVYGLLNSAFQSYDHTRTKLESQQTARIVLDYLVYRLREVDAGPYSVAPENCISCHNYNMDQDTANNVFMPCTADVTIPQKAPEILEHKTVHFAKIPRVADEFQTMTGNFIKFKADLLPLHGFNETFTDAPAGVTATIGGSAVTIGGNGVWDWDKDNNDLDVDKDDDYGRGEPELLEDLNDNNQHDYFGEIWTLELLPAQDRGPYFELVESLDFSSIRPQSKLSVYNRSVYSNSGYTQVPIAYGITGLRIAKAPRYFLSGLTAGDPLLAPTASGRTVSVPCFDPTNPTGCHGSTASAAAQNVYGNGTNMSYVAFIQTHPWWNTRGLSVEVTTTDTKGKHQQFTRLRQFVNFRNLEINQ